MPAGTSAQWLRSATLISVLVLLIQLRAAAGILRALPLSILPALCSVSRTEQVWLASRKSVLVEDRFT
jgi:hypothetical protein